MPEVQPDRSYAERSAALVLLDGGNLPSTGQHVDGSALIGKLLALSEGKIVSPGQDDALRNVELS